MINKSKNMKAKAFGGLGIAVFLCLLMALMPYSGVVENNEVEENTSFVEETQVDESEVQLRDKYDPYGFDAYDPLTEQVGMRDMYSKTYSIGEVNCRLSPVQTPFTTWKTEHGKTLT